MRSLLDLELSISESTTPVRLEISPDALRKAFGLFPTGVAAVCAAGDDGPVGMAVSTFTPVSLDPPLASICLQRSSATWPRLRELPRLGVSLLSNNQQVDARTLAAKDGDRFLGIDHITANDGALLLTGATAWFNCSIEASVDGGDHTIALLRVHEMAIDSEREPLVFHSSRFRRLGL